MLNRIIKTLFVKKVQPQTKQALLIKRDRQITRQERASASCLSKDSDSQDDSTCLSGYFSHNKGLNYIERNVRLCVAVIER